MPGVFRSGETADPGWKRDAQGGLPREGEEVSRSGISFVPLMPTGMQGSTPLDVAAASVIDNNELALALQEQDLEKVREE